jgi:hypothetical protein
MQQTARRATRFGALARLPASSTIAATDATNGALLERGTLLDDAIITSGGSLLAGSLLPLLPGNPQPAAMRTLYVPWLSATSTFDSEAIVPPGPPRARRRCQGLSSPTACCYCASHDPLGALDVLNEKYAEVHRISIKANITGEPRTYSSPTSRGRHLDACR